MEDRIIELALEALQVRKAAVDAEIQKLRAEMTGRTPKPAATRTGRRRNRTAAERKAQSERMRLYWKKKRAASARPAKRAAAKPSKA